jgi:parallel beta-helix repeat protein
MPTTMQFSGVLAMVKQGKLFLGAFLLGCCSVWSQVAQAASYYVATNGNDTNSCVQAQSQSTPKLTLNNAIGCLRAGDTLLVRGGTYGEVLNNIIPSGTSWSNKVRIAAYPNETVWLRPSSAVNVVYINGHSYIEFDGVNVDATRAEGNGFQLSAGPTDTHHIRVQNAEIVGTSSSTSQLPGGAILASGDFVGAQGGHEFINLTIHGGPSNSDAWHGLYLGQPNILVQGCNIFDFTGDGIQLYNGYGQTYGGVIVRNNWVHDARTTFINARHNGILAGSGAAGAYLYNNVVYNVAGAGGSNYGIFVYEGSSSVQIHNNTVYNSSQIGIFIYNSVPNTSVRNNISYRNGTDYLDTGTGTTLTNNLFGVNPTFVNPGVGNFQLQAGSPAIDAGMTISTVPNDIIGMPRPQGRAYDIGAYEFGGGPPAPTGVRILGSN